jgi:RNA polymerase sigma-70 factor (ECF subfamily)
VFLRALRRLATYDPDRASPQTWLFQIARSTVTDYLRKLRRTRGLHVSIDQIHDLEAEFPSPEERLLHEERVRRLLNAVAELRPNDREVLELRYGGQLSHREVADILGITENAATVRVHRALRRLEDKVEEAGAA